MSRFPKCRLCQDEHRLGPCPSFYSQPSRVKPAAVAKREEGRPDEVKRPARAARAVVANGPVANGVANGVANKNAERVRRWRLANRERYNARERERMRASRARAAGRVS